MGKTIRVAGVVNESIVDGPGFRYTVFVQGCPHKCPGCHNPDTHDFGGGTPVVLRDILADIRRNPLLRGVTFSGGEPFCQAEALLPLAKLVKGKGLHLCSYSGYTFEELVEMGKSRPPVKELLELCDVLIDGRFILAERTLEKRFAGSRNQRVLDVRRSLEEGKPVPQEEWQ